VPAPATAKRHNCYWRQSLTTKVQILNLAIRISLPSLLDFAHHANIRRLPIYDIVWQRQIHLDMQPTVTKLWQLIVNNRKRSFLLCLYTGKSPVLIVLFSLLAAVLLRMCRLDIWLPSQSRRAMATAASPPWTPHLSHHTSVATPWSPATPLVTTLVATLAATPVATPVANPAATPVATRHQEKKFFLDASAASGKKNSLRTQAPLPDTPDAPDTLP